MQTLETLESLKENSYHIMEDIPYILLIIAQELRNIRELRGDELFGKEETEELKQ